MSWNPWAFQQCGIVQQKGLLSWQNYTETRAKGFELLAQFERLGKNDGDDDDGELLSMLWGSGMQCIARGQL